MPVTIPEEHLQRLELAVRAAELRTSDPTAAPSLLREGLAGEVPLRLALREDGTLEIQAKAAHPLPEGLRIHRDDSQATQIHALNPAMGRRLASEPSVYNRLQALFDEAPHARIEQDSVRLEVSAKAPGDKLQAALRAALRAASTLSNASLALSAAAERNRQQVRSTAPASEPEAGRRFIKLLPTEGANKPVDSPQHRARLVAEAQSLLDERLSHEQVLAYIQEQLSSPVLARAVLNAALRQHALSRRRGFITVFSSLAIIGLMMFIIVQLQLTESLLRPYGRWIAIAAACSVTFLMWTVSGRYVHGAAAEPDQDSEQD